MGIFLCCEQSPAMVCTGESGEEYIYYPSVSPSDFKGALNNPSETKEPGSYPYSIPFGYELPQHDGKYNY